MLTTIAAIFWFLFALLGWLIVAVLMSRPRKDDGDPPDDPPPSPAAAAFLQRRQAQRQRVGIPHAFEPPWDGPTTT